MCDLPRIILIIKMFLSFFRDTYNTSLIRVLLSKVPSQANAPSSISIHGKQYIGYTMLDRICLASVCIMVLPNTNGLAVITFTVVITIRKTSDNSSLVAARLSLLWSAYLSRFFASG